MSGLTGPCTFGTCGAEPARPFAEGPRCAAHTPAARAGKPEPDAARYCMGICYCEKGCAPPVPLAPVRRTVIDDRVIASGKRRARSLGEYREAQARTGRT